MASIQATRNSNRDQARQRDGTTRGIEPGIAIGRSIPRKEGWDKVTGAAKYTDDHLVPGMLRAYLVTSSHAHAKIHSIDIGEALKVAGVRAVLTGDDTENLFCGEVLEDRPPIARGTVRYWGEPVAVVVADDEATAMLGARAVRVDYKPLPVVNSVKEALSEGATLVHPDLGQYKKAQQPVFPEPGTNIADRARVRRGEPEGAFQDCDVVVEAEFHLPQMDHAAMETRSSMVQCLPAGRINIRTASQSPFEIQKMFSTYFQLKQGDINVTTPLVGGAFGGKTALQLEIYAYLASKAVGGRLVKITNTREHDLASSPVAHGMDARIRMGATRTGRILAADMTYQLDIGAYADSSPRVARAIASECTGPYSIEHVRCDVLSVYTNHTYATAFRGFGHMPMTFAIERTIEKLARELGIDAVELRRRNIVQPGDKTPTQVKLTRNTLGDLGACLDRCAELIGWTEEGPVGQKDGGLAEPGREVAAHRDDTIRARGIACFWKNSSSPPDAISGAIVTMNKDGSLNLSTGSVEFGPGTKTTGAQILAERMKMDPDRIHIHTDVNTKVDPEHWKTVASMATFMVGQAVLQAAEDVIRQLKAIAAIVLRCPPEDLEVGEERVYLADDPDMYVAFKDIAHGYLHSQDGDAVGGQIIGRGSFIMRHLTLLDRDTGKGMPGPSWSVGAQAAEVEFNPRDCTYRLLRAATVIDAGRVINPKTARGVVMGGMSMGLGYGTREHIVYDAQGHVASDQFRTYKMMRVGEQPEYLVDFVETPQQSGPFGARPLGEHSVIAMPAAVANALSNAAGVDFDEPPVTPERIWRALRESGRESPGRAKAPAGASAGAAK